MTAFETQADASLAGLPVAGIAVSIVAAVAIIPVVVMGVESHRHHVIENHTKQFLPACSFQSPFNQAIGCLAPPDDQEKAIRKFLEYSCVSGRTQRGRVQDNDVES